MRSLLLKITLFPALCLLMAACSQQTQLTRNQATTSTLKELQFNHMEALSLQQRRNYSQAINLWYRNINLIDQFNSRYPPKNKNAVSFLNDKISAYCQIGKSYYEKAKQSSNNLNTYKDSLQSYLLCLQFNPTNFRTYDDAIRIATKLNDVARTNKLKKWKKSSIEIHQAYQARAQVIDSKYSSRSPENQLRTKEFIKLYQWAYSAAKKEGVNILADRYKNNLEFYQSIMKKQTK